MTTKTLATFAAVTVENITDAQIEQLRAVHPNSAHADRICNVALGLPGTDDLDDPNNGVPTAHFVKVARSCAAALYREHVAAVVPCEVQDDDFTFDGGEKAGTIRSGATVVVDGTRYFIGGVPEGFGGRQEFQGPIVPGPWAYLGKQASWICNDPSSSMKAVEREQRVAGEWFVVEAGSTISLAGTTYRVVAARNRHSEPTLVRVEE